MFRGANKINLDAKGRLAVPTRYRARLEERCGNRVVVTVDRDYCLLIYPLPEWEEIERRLSRLPTLNRQARRLQRLMIGHATELELDSHGRILLPKELREFAGMERQVMLIGQGNKFELWDEARWSERRDQWLTEESADEAGLAAELETLSF
ncbi:MAG: division/cell wall cluster transcriptional repressor MraZ [Gammaproteobacteria bacterium]